MIISFNFRAHPRREADRGAGAALAPGADESDRAGRCGRPDQLLLHQIQRRRQRDLAAGALPQGRRLHQVVTSNSSSDQALFCLPLYCGTVVPCKAEVYLGHFNDRAPS